MVQRFSQATGIVIETRLASAGLLRQRIEKGERADLFASADLVAPQTLAGATVVELPPDLAVTPANGLTLLTGSTNPAAARFALFMLSFQRQEILARNGFTAVLPPPAER